MKKLLVTLLAAMSLVLAGLATANAAGPPEGHGPPTGGDEAGNNLSVPTIFVGGGEATFGLTCPADLPDPPVDPVDNPALATDDPRTGYELPGYWFVQRVHEWQAQCITEAQDAASVTVDWGDNLEGTALKAGTPIRVEVGLIDTDATAMTGYVVEKLEPSLSDKESEYGTKATLSTDHYVGTQTSFPYTYETINEESGELELVTVGIRVFDPTATFSLQNLSTGTYVVPPLTPMSAEMNSKGAVVYGYNWGIGGKGVKSLPVAGDYRLTFNVGNVDLTETDTAIVHTATLDFHVNTKNSGKSAAAAAHGR